MPNLVDSLGNLVIDRRSLIAGVAGLGCMASLAGCASQNAAPRTSFKIGAIGPLTGATASYGISTTNGAELAVKHFSDHEVPLSYQKEDSQGSPETAVNAYNTLLDWGMHALVGPTLTGPAVSVAASCNDDRVFMITPSASSEDVTDGKDCVFQVCFTDPNQGINAALFLSQRYAQEKIAVIYNASDAYSSGIRDAFVEKAKHLGLDIVGEATFKDDSQSSFNNLLTSVQAKGATLIFAPIYYTPASVLLTNAHEMGYKVKVMGCDGMDGVLGVEGFNAKLAEGLLLMTPFAADDARNADFVAAYQEAYGEVPDQFAADAYDGVHAIYEAIKASGATLQDSFEDVCDKLSAAMLTITVEGLTGTLTWNDKGQVQKDPSAYIIQSGKYVAA